MKTRHGEWRDGWWEGYQLDHAVSWAGRHIEAKMSELDKDGEPRHTLEDLLNDDTSDSDAVNTPDGLAWLKANMGVIRK